MSHPGLTLGGLSLLAAKWLAELRAAWPSHAEALKLALQRFFHQWRQDVQKLTARQWASLAVLALLAFRGGLLQKFLDLLRWSPVRKNFLKDAPAGRGGAHFGDYRQALPKWLADGLQEHSFTEMKPIQRKVLPLALAGHDVVATAPTGSGKTLAFLVPAMVHATNQSSPRSVSEGPIALILAPTRELVMQIKTVAEKLTARARRSCTVAAVYGGQRRMDQLQILKRQVVIHLLVGTVGRLLDFMHPRPGDQKAFKLTRCSFLVLDEGDKMLDDGFEEEVALIGAEARRDKQVLFFSATWPPSVERSARALCRAAPRRVALEPEEFEDRGDQSRALPPSAIRQIVEVPENGEHDSKLPILLRYLEDSKLATPMQQGGGKVLIFVRTITAAEDLATLLQQKFGSKCDAMHGKRKQEQREQSLNQFRMGHTRALIATDVLGRGVDIPDVTMVFIYDFPDDIETYIHRVGRTGRNGRQGKAVSLFHRQYWNAYLAKELQDVLQRCEQEVPVALEEAASAESSWQDWNSSRQWWR